MKTLIVKYLPSGPKSNTRKLLDHFEANIKGSKKDIDLLVFRPPIFDEVSLAAYVKRCYTYQPLNFEDELALKPFDDLFNEVQNSDVIVIATPMYNFSLPGIVKSFFDAIVLKDKAFKEIPKGDAREYHGLLTDKKALVIFTAGGNLTPDSPGYKFNELDSVVNINFNFMGFKETKIVTAGTSNPNTMINNMARAKKELNDIIKSWY